MLCTNTIKLMFSKVDIYIFSGTGNTQIIIDKVKTTFENNDISVKVFPLSQTKQPITIDPNTLLFIAFPVALQGTYPFVWDFINNLPNSNNIPIFMLDTLQAYSGGIVGPIKNIVQKKGYRPLGVVEIKMPTNFAIKKVNSEKNKKIIERGLIKAKITIEKLIANQTQWPRIPILSDIMSLFSRTKSTWKLVHKFLRFQVDSNRCTKCGICSNICPVKAIILDPYPKWNIECVLCQRCFAFCPSNAISSKGKNYKQYKAINLKEII